MVSRWLAPPAAAEVAMPARRLWAVSRVGVDMKVGLGQARQARADGHIAQRLDHARFIVQCARRNLVQSVVSGVWSSSPAITTLPHRPHVRRRPS